VPAPPVIAGSANTVQQILLHSGLLVLASRRPSATGFAGVIYGITALLLSIVFLLLAIRLSMCSEVDYHAAHRLFIFSIVYLFLPFAAILVDHGSKLGGG
jgi:protoheme IX farnesyltransferase